jgi:hypothetical protein
MEIAGLILAAILGAVVLWFANDMTKVGRHHK